eukprot:CAMPEP_0172328748 /NCGR_PEP_ID=MMETSP1058-20130122/60514_1 /TAXON_ID=83371 /ORGANISM="Detonula confervacea, Strain CCMP 353" /LENGTH=400 /DNA_ID=CAMNT_0013045877 /DNA_START=1148 /DNA_END=2347 /DNA_ORIENTATION=-
MVFGCVDRNVIDKVVDFGLNHIVTCDDATWVARMAYHMTSAFPPTGQSPLPRDSHFAAAVSFGLLEMFLKLLSRFGRHHGESDTLLALIELILKACNDVVLQKKTSKAIHLRGQHILDVSLRLTGSKSPHVNVWCKRIVQNILYLVRISIASQSMELAIHACTCCIKELAPSEARFCGKCNRVESMELAIHACTCCIKELAPSEARFCGKCNRVAYCSKECQVKDWKLGHNKLCTKSKAKSSDAVRQNIGAMMVKFNVENHPTILEEATLKGYNIRDCVVSINLRKLPAVVEVMLESDFTGFGLSQISSIIDGQSGEAVAFFCLRWRNDDTHNNMMHTQSYIGNWSDEQSTVKKNMQDELDLMKENPELRERALMELKRNMYTEVSKIYLYFLMVYDNTL